MQMRLLHFRQLKKRSLLCRLHRRLVLQLVIPKSRWSPCQPFLVRRSFFFLLAMPLVVR